MALENLLDYAKSQGWAEEDFEKKVQEKYATCVKENNFNDLQELVKLTRIEPKLSEESVKKVQKKYEAYLKEDKLGEIKWLYGITRVRPKLSEGIVQKKYKSYAKCDWLYWLVELCEISGVEPSKEVYRKFLNYLSDK